MKKIFIIIILTISFVTLYSQSIDDIVGIYQKIESNSYRIEGNDTIFDWDTTSMEINSDYSFKYRWSPMFGPFSEKHIESYGSWTFKKKKIVFNTEYQQDEWRFFESYRPEYGDSIVKVYIQTYDSLIGFFTFQFVGVIHDTTKKSQMLFPDKEFPKQRCIATFDLPSVDKIIFYGDFGRMPFVEPNDKKSNCFTLQYNLSTNWDYQYMKDLEWKWKPNELSIKSGPREKIILRKNK